MCINKDEFIAEGIRNTPFEVMTRYYDKSKCCSGNSEQLRYSDVPVEVCT
jgi:hypothetical protein